MKYNGQNKLKIAKSFEIPKINYDKIYKFSRAYKQTLLIIFILFAL